MTNRDEKEKIEEISTSFTKEEKGKWKAETEESVPSASNQLVAGSSQQLSALTPEQKLTLTQVEEGIDLFFHKDKHPEIASLKELISSLSGCEQIQKDFDSTSEVKCAFCKKDSIISGGFFSKRYWSYFLKKEDLAVPICSDCREIGQKWVQVFGSESERPIFDLPTFARNILKIEERRIFGTVIQQEQQLKKTAWKVYDFAHVFQEIGIENDLLVEETQKLRKEIEKSQAKEESIKLKMQTSKRKNNDLLVDRDNKIVQLTSEITRLKNLLSEQHDEFQKIVSGPDSGKLAMDIAKDQAIKTLNSQVEDYKGQLELALRKNSYIDEDNQDNKEEIALLTDSVERLKEERDIWKSKVDRKEAEIIKNTKFFQQAKEELAEAEKEIKEWKKKYSDESILRSANIEKSNNALLAMKNEKEELEKDLKKTIKDLEKKMNSEWWKTQADSFRGRLAGLIVIGAKRVPLIPASWHQTIEAIAVWDTVTGGGSGSFMITFVIFALFYETIRWLYWKVMDRVYKKEETEKKSAATSPNNDIQWEIVRRILDRDPQKQLSEKKKTKKLIL